METQLKQIFQYYSVKRKLKRNLITEVKAEELEIEHNLLRSCELLARTHNLIHIYF